MPTVSRWMIRISLVYMLVAFTFGALLLINKAWAVHPAIWALMPAHIEMAIFGWIIQLTLGTAYWILPRFLEGATRGSENLAYAMVVLFNAGILMVIAGSIIPGFPNLQLIGRVLESIAVAIFVRLHWNRIVTYNK